MALARVPAAADEDVDSFGGDSADGAGELAGAVPDQELDGIPRGGRGPSGSTGGLVVQAPSGWGFDAGQWARRVPCR